MVVNTAPMTKNLAIFGAGASITSDSTSPVLGNKLFETLKSVDPNLWGKIPDDLVSIFQKEKMIKTE